MIKVFVIYIKKNNYLLLKFEEIEPKYQDENDSTMIIGNIMLSFLMGIPTSI